MSRTPTRSTTSGILTLENVNILHVGLFSGLKKRNRERVPLEKNGNIVPISWYIESMKCECCQYENCKHTNELIQKRRGVLSIPTPGTVKTSNEI